MWFSRNKCTMRAFLLVTMALLLCGCGGGGSTAPSTPMAISGKVSLTGASPAGVTVDITGTATNSLTTDANGSYTVSSVPSGTYTITPSKSGFTFSPSSQTITVANGSVIVPEFTATAVSSPGFTVSGKVTLGGAGQAGVTVTIAGVGSGTTTTDVNGNYSFTGVRNGNCTITPSLAGFTFSPLSQAITVANANFAVPDFTATAISSSFTVSGKVTLNGTGLQGVTVTITIPGGFVIGTFFTDANGNYTIPGFLNGNHTVTPSLTNYDFTPASKDFSVSNGNVTGLDFTAAPTVTGSITFTF